VSEARDRTLDTDGDRLRDVRAGGDPRAAGDVGPLRQAVEWMRQGVPVALATVVRTWGSSPRPAGSHLAVAADGRFAGSVSAGCVEGAVIQEAEGVLAGGAPRRLEYGVTNEEAWAVGLSCGGKLEILLAPADRDCLEAILARVEADIPVAMALSLDAPSDAAADGTATRTADGAAPGAGVAPRVVFPDEPGQTGEVARRALREDRTLAFDDAEPALLLRPYNPAVRLVLVGAVHITRALAAMAAELGWRVTVVDPRRAFAESDYVRAAEVVHAWPDEAMGGMELGPRTAVVTLSHDPKIDDPALFQALRSSAFYVGALGSTRTHGRRLDRLREEGVEPADLARIHGPVGLDIGARSPEEIAVSILSEIVARLRTVDAPG